jgi:hypothetical protein
LPDGQSVDLAALGREAAHAHLAAHPEDVERYGAELAHAWCAHDTQHILAWAAGDLDFDGQLAWLARVLDARGYPIVNLADCLATTAAVVERALPTPAGPDLAERLRVGARTVLAPPGGGSAPGRPVGGSPP